MGEVKWIKVSVGLFDNRKIKQIEALPDGYAIIVCWLKLLCLAGQLNDSGAVRFTEEIPYTEQMLAQQFGMRLEVIQIALKTFVAFEMVEIIDNILHISNWEKYQNEDRLQELKEMNRERVQKHREKKKQEELANCNVTVMLQDHYSNAVDIEKEKEIEEENYIVHHDGREMSRDKSKTSQGNVNDMSMTSYDASYDGNQAEEMKQNGVDSAIKDDECSVTVALHEKRKREGLIEREEVIERKQYKERLQEDQRLTQDKNDSVFISPPLDSSTVKTNIADGANRRIWEREFEELWKIYPRKEGKKNAIRHYIAARREGIPFETIKAGVIRYQKKCDRECKEKEFIAMGSTWFCGHRWEDEYEVEESTLTSAWDAVIKAGLRD